MEIKNTNNTEEVKMVDSDGFGGCGYGYGGMGFIGGLLVGSLWGGNGLGWGNRGNWGNYCNNTQAIDTASITSAVNNVGNQVNNLGMQNLQQTCNTNMNMVNAVSSAYDALNNTLNQNNIALTQGLAGVNSALCQGFGGLNQSINTQGYESRIATNSVSAQLANCCCDLKQEIQRQGCLDRELQREIHTENIQSQLCDAKAKIAALEAQAAFTCSQNAQTAYLISQLKTTA